MNVHTIRRFLKDSGFEQVRREGSHETWKCGRTGKLTSIVLSGGGHKLDRNRVRAIRRQVRKISDSA